MIDLNRTERIIAVVPQTASGPGWSNRVAWVHIVNSANNAYRCECLQPEEQPDALIRLFNIGEVVQAELLASIGKITKKEK